MSRHHYACSSTGTIFLTDFLIEWVPFLKNMTEIQCELPGYAFYHDITGLPALQVSKLTSANFSNRPSMIFEGSANGAPATFLADTGATHCFIDKNFAKTFGFKQSIANAEIHLADGSTQSTTSKTTVHLKIQGHSASVQCFIINMQGQFDVILGDTWLHKTGAVLDYKQKVCTVEKKGLKHTLTPVVQETSTSSSHVNSVLLNALQVKRCLRQRARSFMVKVTDSGIHPEVANSNLSPEMQALVDEFGDVFSPIQDLPPFRNTGHTIPTEPGSKPPFRPMFRLSPKELEEVEKQVAELLKLGLIEPSSSPYGAPVLFVGKKDGSLRMCIDYRALNKITVKNKYPLPRIDQLMDSLAGAKVFTSLDLQSGYHQIRITPEDVSKTAFRTPFGHYQFKVLSFGLTNAPATFQAAMNDMLRPLLGKSVVVYIDDILIYSKDATEHVSHVKQVLELLRANHYHIKLPKCEFEQKEVKFLGHIIGVGGVKVDPAKVLVINEWLRPTNVHGVRSFVGLATYFRKFIEGFSKMVAPLPTLPNRTSLSYGMHLVKQPFLQ